MQRLGKPLKKVWKSLWVIGSCLFFIVGGIILLKLYEDSMRSHERGQLVASIVDQQFQELTAGAERLSDRLADLERISVNAESARLSLVQWSRSLRHESGDWKRPENSTSKLFQQGRQSFFEAAGYRRIGRAYDAAVLQLWTISSLTHFIHLHPFDRRVPEALYMLGVAYVGLGRALPSRMRGERILNLVSELYPDSFWANRSDGVWREAISDES